MGWIETHWYRRSALSVMLLPLAALYCAVIQVRRWLYRVGVLHVRSAGAPVIVVGNITVGGTGKTPLVIWLVQRLTDAGYRPGVVTRGYGGSAARWPVTVTAETDPNEAGDEALVVARQARCPVVADPRRVRGARELVNAHGCNVIVSDDGLQHYALARDVEIAVIDGARRHGNGYCLPAGPLREPVSRLGAVDLIVVNGTARAGEHAMRLQPQYFRSLADPSVQQPADFFRGRSVHAVAGVGNPGRFFQTLRGLGVRVTEHAFPDHHAYRAADLAFVDDDPILMTDKDAVKCERLAGARGWSLAVQADIDEAVASMVIARLAGQNSNVEVKRG